MSGFAIKNGGVARLRGTGLDQAERAVQSRRVLQEYRAHLREAGGGVKSGVVFIGSTDGQDALKRDRALTWRNRSGGNFAETAGLLRSNFESAYRGAVSPQKFDALMKGLDTYLASRGNQFGTRTFAKLVDTFEQAFEEHASLKDAGGRSLGADTAALLSGKDASEAFAGIKASLQIRLPEAPTDSVEFSISKPDAGLIGGRVQQGLEQAFGRSQGDIKPLGFGAVSNAYLMGDSVLTAPKSPADMTQLFKSQPGQGELAAAKAKSPMPHVAKPTMFIVRVSQPIDLQITHRGGEKAVRMQGRDAEAFEVPADKLHTFLDKQPEGAEVHLMAVKMPNGGAATVRQVIESAPLTAQEFPQLAAGIYQGLQEMQQAGLLHHDIKPANVTFDRTSGQVMLIDLGSAVELDLDSGRQTETFTPMSELFTPSNLQISNGSRNTAEKKLLPHGVEVDRYAMAITLMNALAPALTQANPVAAFSAASGELSAAISGQRDPVDLYMNALSAASTPLPESADESRKAQVANAQKARQELEASFERIPDSRQLLATALQASVSGPAGEQAWQSLASLLGLSASSGVKASGLESPKAQSMQLAGDPKLEQTSAAAQLARATEASHLYELDGRSNSFSN